MSYSGLAQAPLIVTVSVLIQKTGGSQPFAMAATQAFVWQKVLNASKKCNNVEKCMFVTKKWPYVCKGITYFIFACETDEFAIELSIGLPFKTAEKPTKS